MTSGDIHELSLAIGELRGEVRSISATLNRHIESTTREQRTVHNIVDASSESIRNVARDVTEMKPWVMQYRDESSEKRGARRLAGFLYAAAAAGGALVVSIFDKLSAFFPTKP